MTETIKLQPLWTTINPVPAAYPWLTEDLTADVVVLGGGVLGALCALKLQEAGVETALLSGDPVGFGGAAVSSGTAQYEMPGGIARLAEKIGIDRAVRAFSLCREGIEALEALVRELDCDCGCRRGDSLLYASQKTEVETLRQEYLLRKHNGLPVEYLSGERAKDLFSFELSGGIVSKRMSVSLDPYRFTHAVLARAASKGARIFENTGIREVNCAADSQVLVASTGKKIHCGRLVLATESGAKNILPSLGGTRTSFAVATEPVSVFAGWPGKCVVSSLSGTLHFSATPDNRIVAMGLDSGMAGVRGRLAGIIPAEAFHEKKYAQLSAEISRMFPGIRSAGIAAAFSCDYTVTPNGLPAVGRHRDYPGCVFSVCGGVSGLAFAPVAARHVVEMVLEKENPDHTLFSLR